MLCADIEGDFIAPARLRKIYRRVFGEAAALNGSFMKSKHISDYIAFLAKLFKLLGHDGWLILFDEAELIGRLGRKSRHKAYLNMNTFLYPERTENIYSIFAFNSSFVPDVVEAKHEYDGAENDDSLLPEAKKQITKTLDRICGAAQLAPLNQTEIAELLGQILKYHGAAYAWTPQMNGEDFLKATDPYGYLLRTRIRAAVEILDQLYQYGRVCDLSVSELGHITFSEEEAASLEEFV